MRFSKGTRSTHAFYTPKLMRSLFLRCVFYFAAWTLLSRMLCAWNQMILKIYNTHFSFFATKTKRFNFFLAIEIYLINVPPLSSWPNSFPANSISRKSMVKIFNIRNKNLPAGWLVPELSSDELIWCRWLLERERELLLLLAKSLYQLNVIQWVDNRKLQSTVTVKLNTNQKRWR